MSPSSVSMVGDDPAGVPRIVAAAPADPVIAAVPDAARCNTAVRGWVA